MSESSGLFCSSAPSTAARGSKARESQTLEAFDSEYIYYGSENRRSVDLEVESVVPIDPNDSGPRIACTVLYRWQVEGRVTHWGHLHERTNEYLARFEMIGTTEGWRIGALDLLEQERINQFDDPEGVDGEDGASDLFGDDEDDDFEL